MGFDRAVSALGFTPESTTPSRTVGTITMFAILIFFAIKAAELLQSPIIAVMLAQVLELGSRILFGTGIILGGVIIARIVSNLVSGAGTEGWLPARSKPNEGRICSPSRPSSRSSPRNTRSFRTIPRTSSASSPIMRAAKRRAI